jgi:hypothetical protein
MSHPILILVLSQVTYMFKLLNLQIAFGKRKQFKKGPWVEAKQSLIKGAFSVKYFLYICVLAFE